jgi:hypothetical protein
MPIQDLQVSEDRVVRLPASFPLLFRDPAWT